MIGAALNHSNIKLTDIYAKVSLEPVLRQFLTT
ncbi:hypothetical protein OCHUTO_0256 [Orientia chuto str. Dubai]|uniref:Integrase n=1 Tax=Orientia chuto str. Dubai TaxID=1359168 RepID=A0A0F3MMU8_9RICK|nr:hypothetical protein OCHUTO_0256 [Orientia chuto str. Dubai]